MKKAFYLFSAIVLTASASFAQSPRSGVHSKRDEQKEIHAANKQNKEQNKRLMAPKSPVFSDSLVGDLQVVEQGPAPTPRKESVKTKKKMKHKSKGRKKD